MLPKCCAEHQKPGTFQRFSPAFQKLFLKRDFFDSLNGPRYRPCGARFVGRMEGMNHAKHRFQILHEQAVPMFAKYR
jgi:hypothetical protein